MPCDPSLTAQLNVLLDTAPVSRRMFILRQVTDLFLASAALYTDEQIELFDIVFVALSQNIEQAALIELSNRLASTSYAPPQIIKRLSCDDAIAIARPTLENSKALANDTIAEIAKTKSHDHLLAIASRKQIGEAVTDALIERDIPEILRKFVANDHARISHIGFAKLISAAKRDARLAQIAANRPDLPDELRPFLKLAL